MFSLQNRDLIWSLYNSTNTVFTLPMVALLLGENDFQPLNQRLNYYVNSGRLLRPRKGVYAKPDYNPEELAGILYTPSYISLEYVLQKARIIFQFDSRITTVSYLSRTIQVDNYTLVYRKLKNEILVNMSGIIRKGNVNIASPERAVLDMLYLNNSYYFDNLNSLNKDLIDEILPIYDSKTLTKRVNKLLKDDRF